ncbi:MAG: polyribonucleotide nucleotidyltransferase [Kiritimatiellae bacterium]|nr:polyribonucleotide nucleotidyltransferase [Kiritimatiellia bacterium]
MENTKHIEIDLAGKKVRFETGLLAKQANGAVTVQIGETVLFSAVTATKTPREGIDFFPLQVEYREKFYAAGRFPGGYFKREARPSEKEILTSRVTDRPIRPLFPETYRNDVQIINTLFSTDGENESDILSINAASAALTLSDLPFLGPIGAVRVGRINGEWALNPTHDEIAKSDLNLTYVGSRDYPLMIEGDAQEVTEPDMLAAMKWAHTFVVNIIDAQLQLRTELGLPEKVIETISEDTTLIEKARELASDELGEALVISGKLERQNKVNEIRESLKTRLLEGFPEMADEAYFQLFDALEIETVRKNVLEKGCRIDGRAFGELRPLDGQVGLLPRVHGSSIFSRGETQTLTTATLGSIGDAQSMDAISGGAEEKRFLLHYNFPPYSVGEVGRIGFTSRREIGHGNLAERSLKVILPDDYPYTIRLVSEIMGSNGSSSMATACAGTLALMDAGVPIKKPVAGISVGLFTGTEKAELVIDILGAEDHCGDMDFKVCGTRDGITGFQVDLKIHGLHWDLVEGAFNMARDARYKILDFMKTVLAEPHADLSAYVPRINQTKINPDKIGLLIGPGGKNIKRIQETYEVKIDIEEDGTVHFTGSDGDLMKQALSEVELMTAEAEIGKIYDGTVKGVKDFGAFVEIFPGKEGLVHISELADYRVGSVEDICKLGDAMTVKCLNVDPNGKIRLSRKAAMVEPEAVLQEQPS